MLIADAAAAVDAAMPLFSFRYAIATLHHAVLYEKVIQLLRYFHVMPFS